MKDRTLTVREASNRSFRATASLGRTYYLRLQDHGQPFFADLLGGNIAKMRQYSRQRIRDGRLGVWAFRSISSNSLLSRRNFGGSTAAGFSPFFAKGTIFNFTCAITPAG